jgi:biofilm protein TabA
MIVDTLANAALYRAVHPRLGAAFDYLASFDPATSDSRFPLDGERVHVLVQSYATRPAEEKKWESHRRYLDVQYVVSGREHVTVARAGALTGATPYNEAKDVVNYGSASGGTSTLLLEGGQFAIFFPDDAHRPGVAVDDGGDDVRKVVVKVLLGDA